MLFTSFFKHLKTKELPYSKCREKHLYVSCFLLHFFRALAALQQNRAQSRLLHFLIVYYLTSPHIMFLPGEIFGWKSAAGTLEPSFFSLYQTSIQLNLATCSTLYYTKLPNIPPYPKVAIVNLNLRISFI